MKIFNLTLLLFIQFLISKGHTFNSNDVAAFKAIRDNAPADSQLKTEWVNNYRIAS
jgi:hypothetical protein